MKAHLNVSIDTDLLALAKEQKLNLSALLNDVLQRELTKFSSKELETSANELKSLIEKGTDLLNQMINRKVELEFNEDSRKSSLYTKLSSLSEIETLTETDLKNSKLMMSLVDTIGEKYGIKTSISEIREFKDLSKNV